MPYDVTHLTRPWDDGYDIVVVTNYRLGRDPDGTVNGMKARAYGSFETLEEADKFVRRVWRIIRKSRTPASNILYHCEYKVEK
jgi:hypothetical protein